MRKRLTSSLSYANVVSTLALVLVVGGGGAYAKTHLIDGKTLKPRSVPGSKIKKGSLTRAEINVKKLGRVADSARLGGKPASSYQRRGNYQPAGSYLTAGGTAANANALGGQPPSAFLAAGRVVSGAAATKVNPPQVVLTYAPLDLTVTTVGDPGSNASSSRVIVVAGSMTLDVSTRSGITNLSPSTTTTLAPTPVGSSSAAVDTFAVRSADQPTVGLTITCSYDTTPWIVTCTGVTFG